MSIFGTTLTVVYTVLLCYVLWRARSVPFVAARVRPRYLLGTGALLWLVFVLARVHGHHGTGSLAAMLEFVGMTCLGSVLLFFVPLLAVDLVTAFGLAFKGQAASLRGLALLAGGALSLAAVVQGFRSPAVVRYEIRLPGLPRSLDGTTLAGLSDTHLGQQLGARWLEARVTQVRELKPDLIVLLGDMVEGHGLPQADLPSVLGRLEAPLGVWFVSGNHESHGRNDAGAAVLEQAGFSRLNDRWVELRPGLVLAGVEDLTARRRRGGGPKDPIGQALAHRPPGATVLLSHTPWQAERASSAGVELMLCGHTHGGQIWPIGYLVRLRYPLVAGLYTVDGMRVIVSRGTGTWGPRMRLWQRGEILFVTLRAPGAGVP